MLDHVGFPVSDFDESKAFYTRVLGVLGYGLVMEVDEEASGGGRHAGFGQQGRAHFWITEGEPVVGRLHVAFAAADQSDVDAFYRAAIASGAISGGGTP